VSDEAYDPRKSKTPVPRHADGSVNWKQTIGGIAAIVTVLTTGGFVVWPDGKDATIARQAATIEGLKKDKLDAIEVRLEKIEEEQRRASKFMARIAAKLGVR